MCIMRIILPRLWGNYLLWNIYHFSLYQSICYFTDTTRYILFIKSFFKQWGSNNKNSNWHLSPCVCRYWANMSVVYLLNEKIRQQLKLKHSNRMINIDNQHLCAPKKVGQCWDEVCVYSHPEWWVMILSSNFIQLFDNCVKLIVSRRTVWHFVF